MGAISVCREGRPTMANETFTVVQTTDPNDDVRPGVIVTTTVEITNNSTNTNAGNVSFDETLNGMTIVDQFGDNDTSNDVNVSPIAFADSYNAVGNVTL